MHNVSAGALLPLNLRTDNGLGIYALYYFREEETIHFQFQSFLLKTFWECIFLGTANVNKLGPVHCLIRNLTFPDINCSSSHIAGVACEE